MLACRSERHNRWRMKAHSQSPAITIWFTGLSGAGKSTLAAAMARLPDVFDGPLSVLDGDVLRSGLCQDLGFTEEDRTENVRRVAEVAKLLNDAGVTVLCALISPLRVDRERAAQVIGMHRFVEVFVAASLATCELRDTKGLYKRARDGVLPMFTGIGSAYEAPTSAAVVLDTSNQTVEESIAQLVKFLRTQRGCASTG